MPEISESAQKAALAIVERIKKGAPDLDLCLVSQGGDCRDFNGCADHAAKVLAAIIDSHMEAERNEAQNNRKMLLGTLIKLTPRAANKNRLSKALDEVWQAAHKCWLANSLGASPCAECMVIKEELSPFAKKKG